MLLCALCWLTLPAVFAPVERWLVGAACLPPRLWASWFAVPAMASAPAELRTLGELTEDLHRRVRREDERGTHPLQDHHDAVHCAVVATARRGGGGLPCELRLDHSHAEVADCSQWVTKGESLVGMLVRPGQGPAALDRPHDPARVMLLNHPQARPLFASVELGDGDVLRTVVRGAATVDPAALRVDLWDDPYRGASLDRGGLAVRTAALSADDAPAGLLLGQTLIWGYPGVESGPSLTLGVYVVPGIEHRALSHVVLWRPEASTAAAAAPSAVLTLGRTAAVVHDLPGARNGRHLVVADGPVPDQAAVVQDGLFLGTARGLAFGTGLVTSFVASRQRWSLLLLPDDPLLPPRELEARIVATDRNLAWLRCSARPGADRLCSGYLFTGSNGLHCPAGLWIGRAEPHPHDPDLLQVLTPIETGPRPCEVLGGTSP
jgi:hypothetical protein